MQEEILKGNDKWYCGKCKQHVVATKKMEIWSCPDYLIIHLKRFSHSRGMFGGRKINNLIQFPLEGLDLTNYLLNNKETNKKTIYDLYAVSNHFGSLNGGHYTAFCRNPIYNKWFDFDDSNVSKLSPGKVNTKAAYVLFYKKRQ
jgi:ubiquitin C-terminal hydrolase